MSSAESHTYVPSCSEFTEFTHFLTTNRKLDDNIIFPLNKLNYSSQCEDLWKVFETARTTRVRSIQNCIQEIEASSPAKEPAPIHSSTKMIRPPTDFNLHQRQTSFLKSELEIEDILRSKAIKTFKSRCPGFQASTQRT
eukprot:TRINITY_DN20339_c0_g1_i1.p1 TRINITY_DN20339_c0_g1~~TRINITY_DN20339_c0_g1_i1.p1  ORF type:complete len:139 (-),score=5.98 TRINITY_DN20339_c0_g1_i1:205-621(-)